MLPNWTELLPLFVVRHFAQKLETVRQNGMLVKVPRPGVMIQTEDVRDKYIAGFTKLNQHV